MIKYQILIVLCLLCSCSNSDNISLLHKKAMSQLLSNNTALAYKLFKDACKLQDSSSCIIINNKITSIKSTTPIISSLVKNKSITINAVNKSHHKLHMVLKGEDSNEFLLPQVSNLLDEKSNLFQLSTFKFTQLKDNNYYVYLFNHLHKLIDIRYFKNFNPLDENNSKIAIVSCMNERYKKKQKKIWGLLEKEEADLVLFIGDNAYIDVGEYRHKSATNYQIWKRHFETRLAVQFFYQKKLIPTLAVWDDHDYGKNNGGVEFANKQAAAHALKSFFPHPPITTGLEYGPGISYFLTNSKVDIMFLDNRSFREQKGQSNHLGQQQLNFFKKVTSKSDKPLLIVKGDQYYGDYHQYESYKGYHPEEFKRFNDIYFSLNRSKLLISGDRHLSEILKFGKDSYEITSSPIHSTVYPGSIKPGQTQYRVFAMDDKLNYGLLSIDNSAANSFKIIFKDIDGKVRFKDVFSF
jgi:hypothetical protein